MSLLGRRHRQNPGSDLNDPVLLPGAATRTVTWTQAECEVLPLLGERGHDMLAAWRTRRPEAVSPLQGFVHGRIFDVRPEEVAPLLNPPMCDWPFKEGTRKEDWSIESVDNMTGGEPLVLAMHRFVEAHGRVPGWHDIKRWMGEPHVLPTFVAPAWDMYNALPQRKRPSRERWQMAIAWRIGNAYLSFLREMDFLSRMIHAHDIPLRTHIVVDSVLKVDFWYWENAVCLYIPNKYRKRK